MSYMNHNVVFAGGIQELSFDEIGFVSGGLIDAIDGEPWLLANKQKSSENSSKDIDWGKVVMGSLEGAFKGSVVGAVSGAVGGAIVGSAAAGAGAAPGAVGGALVGAATGAAGGLVDGAIDAYKAQNGGKIF